VNAAERYRRKISGPVMDRIDLNIEVSGVAHERLGEGRREGATSAEVRARVLAARTRAEKRLMAAKISARANADIPGKHLPTLAALDAKTQGTLNTLARKHDLSARSYTRVWKLARTIADLASREKIVEDDILEALQYRPKQLLGL
jgi:magnesium chelatase family protein